ncbi:MAG: LysR family transcriptional regulator [Pseudomonadota bacterium]
MKGPVAIELKPRLVKGGERALGPGKADLLDLIESTGSISAAARKLNMSYSRAWALVDAMNRAFKAPLVEAAPGGKAGGGARVTETGRIVVRRYRVLQARLDKHVAPFLEEFAALLK